MRDAHCAPVRALYSRVDEQRSARVQYRVRSLRRGHEICFSSPRVRGSNFVVASRRSLPRPVHTECPFSGTSDRKDTPVGFNGPSTEGESWELRDRASPLIFFLSSHFQSLEYSFRVLKASSREESSGEDWVCRHVSADGKKRKSNIAFTFFISSKSCVRCLKMTNGILWKAVRNVNSKTSQCGT